MLESEGPIEKTTSGDSVTIGNGAGTMAVGILVVLSLASDGRLRSSRPASSAVVPETIRPEPIPTREVETPRQKPPQAATPAPGAPASSPTKPRTQAAEMPAAEMPAGAARPPAVAIAPTVPRPSELPPAERPGQRRIPSPKSEAPPERTPTPTETAPPQPVAVTLDLSALEQRLRDTKAIGVLTKLSLKNQVDDLLAEFREFHRLRDQGMLAKLRQTFDLLLMKVLSLLQDGDPGLARDVSSSREALWNILIDPDKFKNL